MPPSVSSLLESLSKRPNVQSILILSRQDGSVINATGFLSQTKSRTPSKLSSLQAQGPPRSGVPVGQSLQLEDDESQDARKSLSSSRDLPSPAEMLAGSIFLFVSAAASLSGSMESVSIQDAARIDIASLSEGDGYTGRRHLGDKSADAEGTAEANEVQLIRMRTRRQEIIIFPDSKYLCCVIQAGGKSGHANGDGRG